MLPPDYSPCLCLFLCSHAGRCACRFVLRDRDRSSFLHLSSRKTKTGSRISTFAIEECEKIKIEATERELQAITFFSSQKLRKSLDLRHMMGLFSCGFSKKHPFRRQQLVESTGNSVPFEVAPEELADTKTFVAKLHDFETLPQKRGEEVITRRRKDQPWRLSVYPRGHLKSSDSTEYISVYLDYFGGKDADRQCKVKFTIKIGVRYERVSEERIFVSHKTNSYSWGWKHFAPRGDVLSECVDDDGTLNMHLKIQVLKGSTWYPKPTNKSFYAKPLLDSPVGSDLCLSVGKDPTSKFHGHKSVFFHRARGLYNVVENVSMGQEFELHDISSAAFKILREYIYVDNLPNFDANDEELAKECLLLANRFVCVFLKLHIESEITYKMVTTNNAADWLCIADRHTCPLLKEKCMTVCADNLAIVKATTGWKGVKESSELLEEMLDYRGGGDVASADDNKDFDRMTVRMLRDCHLD